MDYPLSYQKVRKAF